jgi:hypothetical protein
MVEGGRTVEGGGTVKGYEIIKVVHTVMLSARFRVPKERNPHGQVGLIILTITLCRRTIFPWGQTLLSSRLALSKISYHSNLHQGSSYAHVLLVLHFSTS